MGARALVRSTTFARAHQPRDDRRRARPTTPAPRAPAPARRPLDAPARHGCAPRDAPRDAHPDLHPSPSLRAAAKTALMSAIAACLMSSAPPLAFADDAPPAANAPAVDAVDPNASGPSAASARARSDSAPDVDVLDDTSASPGTSSDAGTPPGVPSGTYPLAASAPLPSELKAAGKSAAAANGGGGGDDGSSSSKRSDKRAVRLEELNALRVELDLKELEVRQKSQQLLRQEQTTAVLQEELELARRLNAILKSEVDRVKEESKLSIGLCAQVGGFP